MTTAPPFDDDKLVCLLCGYTYTQDKGDPGNGVPAGTSFRRLPSDWRCPKCRAEQNKFARKA